MNDILILDIGNIQNLTETRANSKCLSFNEFLHFFHKNIIPIGIVQISLKYHQEATIFQM